MTAAGSEAGRGRPAAMGGQAPPMTGALPVTSLPAGQVSCDLYCLSDRCTAGRLVTPAAGSQWAAAAAGTPRPPSSAAESIGAAAAAGGPPPAPLRRRRRRPQLQLAARGVRTRPPPCRPPTRAVRPSDRPTVRPSAVRCPLSAVRRAPAGDIYPLTCRPVSAPCQINAAKLVSRRTSKLPQ